MNDVPDIYALAFDHPWALLGFTVFVPFFLYDLFSARKKRIQKSLSKPVLSKPIKIKLFFSKVFFRLFLAFSIIALAGPRWGVGQTSSEYRRAADVVIAIDVSRSMELPDGQGPGVTRLERGLAIVRETVAAVPGIRYGVAISRGRGIVAVPLTWDNGAALAFLQAALDGPSLTGRGTNLEDLIDAAAGAFQNSSPADREILLVSDGEALSGSIQDALKRCNRDGIAVTAIAVGSDEGEALPQNDSTIDDSTTTDNTDDSIISRRNQTVMRAAAGQTGGVYIDGNSDNAAEALIARLHSLAVESSSKSAKKEHKARWHIFAILAIMAIGMSKLSLLKMKSEE